ncbi:MAG TPA: D-amino acid aminotransferase [Gammaproteobacteria bacterium]|nr:D-amino acid aminotransferase [Gammaproteobacteria bacterium]
MTAQPTVYLNGEFLPLDQAKVSVLDRGFIFGDGVYEVIPVYGGQLFRLNQHLQRLDYSLAGIRLDNPLVYDQWNSILEELVERNATEVAPGTSVYGDQSIYLQVTRGVAKRDHAFPKGVAPTVFVMSNPLAPLPASLATEGVAAITLDDIRWRYCNIKAITLLPNILLRQQALDADAAEAILISNGEVTEGAASNLFIVKDNILITPPKGPRLLPGITRDVILELAETHGIACREGAIRENELRVADEVWLTSSTKEILPVTRLDGKAVSGGKPGPMWARVIALYQDYKRALRDVDRA